MPLLALADTDIEHTPRRILDLEAGGPYGGHDGIRSWWEALLGVVPDYSTEVEEVRVLGDVTVARVRLRGHGRTSGPAIEQTAWQAAQRHQKKCVRWHTVVSEAEALDAAGLRE